MAINFFLGPLLGSYLDDTAVVGFDWPIQKTVGILLADPKDSRDFVGICKREQVGIVLAYAKESRDCVGICKREQGLCQHMQKRVGIMLAYAKGVGILLADTDDCDFLY